MEPSAEKKEQFVIQGLAGIPKLSGTLSVRGAKNAALKACAASLLFKGEMAVANVPEIEDIKRAIELLENLGAEVTHPSPRSYAISFSKMPKTELSSDIASKLRSSVVFTGPLLARAGKVSFPHPGGCLIGARPIDLFLDGFKKMGARVREENGRYGIDAPEGKLRGAEIFFKTPSVTGTETLMMAAVLARGTTVLKNAAMEPEIAALADFLNLSGAKIHGAGTAEIIIKGTGLLTAKKPFKTPPDRIEGGSFLILAALAARDVTITDCEPAHLEALIEHLRGAGVSIEVGKKTLRVKNDGKKQRALSARDVKTHEYPGFPTDLQAPLAVLLSQAEGNSLVFETIFEGRFRYVEALKKMGAKIEICDPHRIIVSGPVSLVGRTLESPDLRAGLAYIIAALVAEGESVIHNVYTIDRGYERIEERLQKIGADIKRMKNEE